MSEHKNLYIPLSILLSGLLFTIGYRGIQISKNRILEEDNKRDYVQSRREECYNIYYKEMDIHSNTSYFNYHQDTDTCTIQYKNPEWMEGDNEDERYFDTDF